MLLYDLTSTYFEINASDLPEGDKRRHPIFHHDEKRVEAHIFIWKAAAVSRQDFSRKRTFREPGNLPGSRLNVLDVRYSGKNRGDCGFERAW